MLLWEDLARITFLGVTNVKVLFTSDHVLRLLFSILKLWILWTSNLLQMIRSSTINTIVIFASSKSAAVSIIDRYRKLLKHSLLTRQHCDIRITRLYRVSRGNCYSWGHHSGGSFDDTGVWAWSSFCARRGTGRVIGGIQAGTMGNPATSFLSQSNPWGRDDDALVALPRSTRSIRFLSDVDGGSYAT